MSKLVKYKWSPSWYIRYQNRVGRYRKISTQTSNKKLAEQIRAQFDATLQLPPEEHEQTVEKLLDAYLMDRKGVVASYDSLYYASKPLKQHFGQTQPRHITNLQNKQYIQIRRKSKKSDGTIIKELVTLRSALSFGIKKNWIEKSPYIELPPRPAAKSRWLSHEEATALVDSCGSPHIRLFVLLAIKTGARKSAILELTWDRISFDKEIIIYPIPEKNHGKKRRAVVPMSASLKKELILSRELAQSNWVMPC